MRALPNILKSNSKAQVIIVGGDDVSYGSRPQDAPNWRTKLLKENKIDLERVNFLGKVPYFIYQKVLQVSAVHVYLTYPFVLSWSCLEAMASGCLMVVSNTKPVQEVITHQYNGLLVDFFSPQAITEQILQILEQPENYQYLRQNAYQTAQNYSINKGNIEYEQLLALPAHVN